MFDQLLSLELARVTCSGMIMMLGQDVRVLCSWHVHSILIKEDTIINPPVRQGRLHGGKTDAMQGVRGSGEDRVVEGVKRNGSTKFIVKQANKHRVRQ